MDLVEGALPFVEHGRLLLPEGDGINFFGDQILFKGHTQNYNRVCKMAIFPGMIFCII